MSTHALTPSRELRLCCALLVGCAVPGVADAGARLSGTYGSFPMHFEANRGQAHPDVRFLARGSGYGVFFTDTGIVLALGLPSPQPSPASGRGSGPSPQPSPASGRGRGGLVVRMSLIDAASGAPVTGVEPLPGKAHYFIGADPARWRTHIPTYAKVRYREVYPGIDLICYGSQRQLEYDFVVAPGADPQEIVLGFGGAERLEIDARGALVLHVAGGAVYQHKPVIYQELNGARQRIEGSYVLRGVHRVGFAVASYDATRRLFIDPVVSYASYLGGSGDDVAQAIAVDRDGSAYITGYTTAADFPTTAGAFRRAAAGSANVFVTKLNRGGSGLLYSTYIGGSADDLGSAIAVDALGNAYIAGTTTSNDYPVVHAFQPALSGSSSAFVTKLNPSGSGLAYSTYLGGGGELGLAIAVNARGNASVAGYTVSADFPTTPEAFQRAPGGGADIFVAQLDPAGSGLVFSTYLGGSGEDSGLGIALDGLGNTFVTGYTSSRNFPTTPGSLQSSHAGGHYDGFVTRLNSTGSVLAYSTYLGGGQDDQGVKIAVDTQGSAHVTGHTASGNFPTTPGALQGVFAGGAFDAFVTKLTANASTLVYSTYLGGSSADHGAYNEDRALGIALDGGGSALVTGITTSLNFPTTNAFQRAFGGDADAFVTKLDAGGNALYSSYLGGAGWDSASAVAVDSRGSAYVAGQTNSVNFPTTPGAFQPAFAGGSGGPGGSWDAFAAKIEAAPSDRALSDARALE